MIQILNYRIKVFAALLLFTVLFSCKKKDGESVSPVPTASTPLVTTVGTPIGTSSSASIGISGGTIQSADGLLTLNIPAGALSSTTQISIQPITNEAPLGLGYAYRLEPTGTTFSVPIQIVFTYTDSMLSQLPPEFLWIVTQASNHSWNALQHSALDKLSKTVSVQSTHFSDWGLGKFVDLTLNPSVAYLPVGQSIALKISGFEKSAEVTDDDELVPLTPISNNSNDDLTPLTVIPPVESQILDFHLVQWTMNGSPAPVSNSFGTLSESNGLATFTAPAQIPSGNPVAVTVELWTHNKANQYMSFYVTSNITIVEYDMYITMHVDGYDNTYYQSELNPNPNNMTQIVCSASGGKLGILAQHTVNSNMVTTLIFDINNPSIGTRQLVGSNASGNDDITFLTAPTTLYELNWDERTLNTATSSCDVVHRGGDISLTISQYTGTGSIVVGHFSGILYEDLPNGSSDCLMPISHAVDGDFRLLVY